MGRKKTRHCDWRLPAAEMCAECLELRRKYGRELNKTPQARESMRRYQKTAKGREVVRRYQKTAKGREAARRYAESPKGIESVRRYKKTAKGRETAHKYYLNVVKPAVEAARRNKKEQPCPTKN